MMKSSGKSRLSFGRLAGRAVLTAAAMAALCPSPGSVSADPAGGTERSLAGISILSPGAIVTRKFGNPDRILVGGLAPAAPGASGTGSTGPNGQPGPGGQPAQSQNGFPGGSAPGSLPGFPTGMGGMPGGMPGGLPGMPSGAPGGLPGTPGSQNLPPPKLEVTLIYDHLVANGGSLEFTISPDKRVIQIRETGFSGPYRTARGVALGQSYAAVLGKYGYPENQYITGSIINADFKDTYHCGFQFLDQKLVGIIVAAVE